MDLEPIGATAVEPVTHFHWHKGKKATVELTDLQSDTWLVQVSKAYRVLSQDEETYQETWARNLGDVHDYLAEMFPQFQISVDYVNEVVPEATGVVDDAHELKSEAEYLVRQRNQLQEQIERLERSVEHGFSETAAGSEAKLEKSNRELEDAVMRLEQVADELEQRQKELGLWRQNGTMVSYVFSYSTDPQVTSAASLEDVVGVHLQNAKERHDKQLKQTLEGSNFKLNIRELDQPRVFNRLEHSLLLNPDSFKQVIDEHPCLTDQLTRLRNSSLAQFQAYTLQDIETETGTVERRKATPARAVQSLVKQLDRHTQTQSTNLPVPSDQRPYIGTLADTKQVVGFDPADYRSHGMVHYYLVGRTGAGKTYAKRVLLENCISLGYNTLSIVPGDTQGVGLNLPNTADKDVEQPQGIAADQYWPGHDHLLDLPDDTAELFNGTNVVTLLDHKNPQSFVQDVFLELSDVDELTQPLFVFLEEAHNFADDKQVIEAIEKIGREGRKFGVHLVLASQFPQDYSRDAAPIRKNLNHIFMKNIEKRYVRENSGISDPSLIDGLDTGEAVPDWDFGDTTIKFRLPMTYTRRIENRDDNALEKVGQRFQSPEPVEFDQTAAQNRTETAAASGTVTTEEDTEAADNRFSADEQELLAFIHRYIEEFDYAPSKRKCYDNETRLECPFSQPKTEALLEQLVEKDAVKPFEVTRDSNTFNEYRPMETNL